MTAGWSGTVGAFVEERTAAMVHRLAEHHREAYRDSAGSSQVAAWQESLEWLNATFRVLDGTQEWGLLLEYELPFENGRRPDAIVLAGDHATVLEFKQSPIATRAAVDQVIAYARDLQEYHSGFRSTKVFPVLALPRGGDVDDRWEGLQIVGPSFLPRTLRSLAGSGKQLTTDAVTNGVYAPLPTLVEAARRVFRNEPLPAIKRAESAGIPQVLEWLHQLVAKATADRTNHLVLITGVPGAGKTLVGLQYVHESGEPGQPEAWFLSGNQPLVEVLQQALHSTVFVRSMHAFVQEYGIRRRARPATSVWVFDEAQRAFSRDYSLDRHRINKSEPELLVELAAEQPGGSVLIGLIGEGQEIYRGEEAGIAQWAEAIAGYGPGFMVHLPPHLAAWFSGDRVSVVERLNLTTSLRTHRASSSHDWVTRLMRGNVEQCKALAIELQRSGYVMYWTTDLAAAKAYAMNRYADEPDKRYGLIASSMARYLDQLGVNVGGAFYLKTAKWFNAPRSDPFSSCQLALPATEFQCQGLELDLPIVCWGNDLGWVDGAWKDFKFRKNVRDNRQLRVNTYRVLLTRGRDGFIVFVPPELPANQTPAILDVLSHAGVTPLTGVA